MPTVKSVEKAFEIFGVVCREPGLTAAEIQEEVGDSLQTVQNYLETLALPKIRFVEARKGRCFPGDGAAEAYKAALAQLARDCRAVADKLNQYLPTGGE